MVAYLYKKGIRNVKKIAQLTELGKSANYETIKRIQTDTDMIHIGQQFQKSTKNNSVSRNCPRNAKKTRLHIKGTNKIPAITPLLYSVYKEIISAMYLYLKRVVGEPYIIVVLRLSVYLMALLIVQSSAIFGKVFLLKRVMLCIQMGGFFSRIMQDAIFLSILKIFSKLH